MAKQFLHYGGLPRGSGEQQRDAALVADLTRRQPRVVELLRAEGTAIGAAAERARILGLEALSLAGHETLLAAAKRDGVTTPAAFAQQVIAAEQARQAASLEALDAMLATAVAETNAVSQARARRGA